MKPNFIKFVFVFMALPVLVGLPRAVYAQEKIHLDLPDLREKAVITFAPEVPPPIKRKKPAVVEVHLDSSVQVAEIKPGVKYKYWTFNGQVPGPFIRARVGDTLEIHHTNTDASGMPHNIDFHAVTGPGGGAPVTTVVKGEERVAWFKLLVPGLYMYHCAAPPVMDHIANGMYGAILVEPAKGLPKVDREFYVLQSEFYTKQLNVPAKPPMDHEHMAAGDQKQEDAFWGEETGPEPEPTLLEFSHQAGLDENPTFVVFNGKYGSLMGEGALKAKVGERVRIFFADAGPNLVSSFHVIGAIFDKVYREGDLISPPGRGIQSTLVPAGGTAVVEFTPLVPGTLTLVDHAIFRVEKGAVGYLNVEGPANPQVYTSDQEAVICKGCLVHP